MVDRTFSDFSMALCIKQERISISALPPVTAYRACQLIYKFSRLTPAQKKVFLAELPNAIISGAFRSIDEADARGSCQKGIRVANAVMVIATLFTGGAAAGLKAYEEAAEAATAAADADAIPKFCQATASPKFSKDNESLFKGKTIGQVTDMLRNGQLSPKDVPVEYINRDGVRLAINTRSTIALRRANIPISKWNLIDKTGDLVLENKITEASKRPFEDTPASGKHSVSQRYFSTESGGVVV